MTYAVFPSTVTLPGDFLPDPHPQNWFGFFIYGEELNRYIGK